MPGGASDPIGQRRTIEDDALALVDLRLAIERQVIGVFGDEHVRHRRIRRQAAFDQSRRRRRLNHDVLAGAASIFGTAHDQHPELGRHDVEPLGDILTDPMELAFAARTGFVADIDDRFDARQMRRQRAPVRTSFPDRLRAFRWGFFLVVRRRAGLGLLGLFEREQQLIFRKRLGSASEAMTLQFLDDLDEAVAANALGAQHRLERFGIVGKRVDRLRHEPRRP